MEVCADPDGFFALDDQGKKDWTLQTLESGMEQLLPLVGWPPEPFQQAFTRARALGLRRYPHADLTRMSRWRNLKTLWLAYGGLETLAGIPEHVRELELAALRKLRDISALRACPEVERLIIEACPALSSLSGIDACHALKILSLFNLRSKLQTLGPLRNLPNLNYLFMTEIAGVLEPDESVLDSLQQLETVIISRRLGVPEERLRSALLEADIRFVR